MASGAGPSAPALPAVLADGSTVCGTTTTRAAGDFRVDQPDDALVTRRRAVVDHPWVWLHQVHGAQVVTVGADERARPVGAEADALVTAEAAVALAVHTADCAPILLWSPEGVLGAAHAGWRGLAAGVVEATVAAMGDLGASAVEAWLGPCIGVECYEFGPGDLSRIADDLGYSVVGETTGGRPALDLAAAVAVVAERAGIDRLERDGGCTACDRRRWFSHRAGDHGRQATVIWRDRPR